MKLMTGRMDKIQGRGGINQGKISRKIEGLPFRMNQKIRLIHNSHRLSQVYSPEIIINPRLNAEEF